MRSIWRVALVALAMIVMGGTAVQAMSGDGTGSGTETLATPCVSASTFADDVEGHDGPVEVRSSCDYTLEPAPGGGHGGAISATAFAQVCVFDVCSGTDAPVTVGTTGAGAQPPSATVDTPTSGGERLPALTVVPAETVCIGSFCNAAVTTPPVNEVSTKVVIFDNGTNAVLAANGSTVSVRGPQTCVRTGSAQCPDSGTGADTEDAGLRSDMSGVVTIE
jgi:hypothetical protein